MGKPLPSPGDEETIYIYICWEKHVEHVFKQKMITAKHRYLKLMILVLSAYGNIQDSESLKCFLRYAS